MTGAGGEINQSVDPTIARERLLAGICPFCSKGPFALVAGHVARAHGIPGRDLKDLAHLPYSTALASNDLVAKRVEAAKRQNMDMRRLQSLRGSTRSMSRANRDQFVTQIMPMGWDASTKITVEIAEQIKHQLSLGVSLEAIAQDHGLSVASVRTFARYLRLLGAS